MRGDFDEDEDDDVVDECHHGVLFSEVCDECEDETADEIEDDD